MPRTLSAIGVLFWGLVVVSWLAVLLLIYAGASELAHGDIALTILFTVVGVCLVIGVLAFAVWVQADTKKQTQGSAEALGLSVVQGSVHTELMQRAASGAADPDLLGAAEDVLGDIGDIRDLARLKLIERDPGGLSTGVEVQGMAERALARLRQRETAPHRFLLLNAHPQYYTLMWGARHGRATRVFGETEPGEGGQRYTCVMVAIPDVPSPIVIAPSRLKLARPLPPQIRLDDPTFDKAFRVHSADDRTTKGVLDAMARERLVTSAAKDLAFELNGDRLLCRGKPRARKDLPGVVEFTEELAGLLSARIAPPD